MNARFKRTLTEKLVKCVLLAVTLCVVGTVGGSSHAAVGAKERLIVFHQKQNQRFSATDAAWVKRLTRWALRKQPGFSLVPTSVIATGGSGTGVSAKVKVRLRLLTKNLKHAKVLYKFRKYGYSIKRLQLALKLHKAVFRYVSDASLLRQLYVYMAVNALYLRRGKVTRQFVLKAILYDKDYLPSPAAFPATFVSYYKSVRQWLQRQPSYSVQMETVPSGARVYYNYRYVGRAPVTVSGMKPGKHPFHLSKQGYKLWQRDATLNPRVLGNRRLLRNTVTLKKDPSTLSLEGVPVFARGADLDPGLLRRLQRICLKANTKHLFVIRFLQRGQQRFLRLARFRRDKKTIRYRLVPIGRSRAEHRQKVVAFAARMSRALVPAAHRGPVVVRSRRRVVVSRRPVLRRKPPRRRALWQPPRRRKPVVARVTPPPRRTPPVAQGTPAHKTWWFWTSIVGGVAVAAAATVVVLVVTQPPPSATFIIATPEQNVTRSLKTR